MLGKYWIPSREGFIKDLKGLFLWEAMSYGFDVVIDNMNLSENSIKDFIEAVRHHNGYVEDTPETECSKYSIEYKSFKTPLEVCIERDSKRENPIGEEIIRNTYNKHIKFYERD